jgi:opacity protein-like surface antigen
MSLFAASGAQAQNCVLGPATAITNMNTIGTSPAAVSGVVGSAITAASTAFLLQSTAFIGSPTNPAPGQQGGGIWVRGVGGEVGIKSTTNSAISSSSGLATSDACSQKVNENFGGVQFGADTAKLNYNGWNLHLGTTAGYLDSSGSVSGGAFAFTDPVTGTGVGGGSFNNDTKVPFFGIYAAATNGGFSIDGLLRWEYYQTTLNAPGANLFGQSLDAQGLSFSSSAAYQWQIPNSNWFLEPSAGVIISRIKVDPFNYLTTGVAPGASAAFPTGDTLSGSLQLANINSDIGRLGLRAGTTIQSGNMIWQPFGAVSVWHEFGGNPSSTFTTCPGCVVVGAVPVTLTSTSSTTTFGTFGQYSLGISGAVAGTGWLGFARIDYRDGSNLEGFSGTGGIRYQFSPGAVAGVMPVKAPVFKAPVNPPVNWTGFYIGGFGGAIGGTADWGYTVGAIDPHVAGFEGGGRIGYDWQNASWVLGVSGDLAGTNLKGGEACGGMTANGATGTPSPMFQMTCNASANWLATAAGRIGYTPWNRVLFYGRAGGAWTTEQFSATCNEGPLLAGTTANAPAVRCTNPAGVTSSGFTSSANRGGWLLGWGTEFALAPNWSALAETNYINFGDRNVTASDGTVINAGFHLWETKIGLNYRFSTGGMLAK